MAHAKDRGQGQRSARVGQLIAQELATLISTELKDPRVGFATITEVRPAPDLRSARVFVSVYGEAETRAQSLEGLRAASGFLSREVGHRLQLRFAPRLSFSLDESLDRAERLDTLLDAISEGETETPTPRPSTVSVPVENERALLARSRENATEAQPTPKRKAGRTKRRRR